MQAPGIDFSVQPLLEIYPAIICVAVTPVVARYALHTDMVEERFAVEVCLYIADLLADGRLARIR